MSVVTITGSPFANGYVPTISEWNTNILGALSASINDINYGQVSASLVDTAVSANSTDKLPRTAAVKTYVDGQINGLQIIQEDYRLISGAADIWGTPNFLLSGASNDFSAVSGLSFVINGTTYTLSATTHVSGLTLASAGVSATLSAGTYAATSAFTKTEGEFGDTVIIVDAYHSAFTAAARLDTQQAFKTGTEYMLGKVSRKSSAAGELGIEKCKRGIGASSRVGLADNDVIYLKEANYIFMNSDMSLSATTLPPKYQSTDPGSGTTGEYYFNTTSRIWKRYSGSWAQQDAIPLGVIVCDESGVVAVDHADYDVAWDDTYECDVYPIMEGTSAISAVSGLSAIGVEIHKVNVAGVPIFMPSPRELVLSAAILSTLTEASATLYYLYLTPLGEFYFDTVAPRDKGKKKGYYHPKYYWRNIGFWYNNSASNLENFIQNRTSYEYVMNGTDSANDSVSTQKFATPLTTGFVLYQFSQISQLAKSVNMMSHTQGQPAIRIKGRGLVYGTIKRGYVAANPDILSKSGNWPMQNRTIIAAHDGTNATLYPEGFCIDL